MSANATADYVQINEQPWMPFPAALSAGGIRWKLLHVSPEMGGWTAIFDCPKGSSFNRHVHLGPAHVHLQKALSPKVRQLMATARTSSCYHLNLHGVLAWPA